MGLPTKSRDAGARAPSPSSAESFEQLLTPSEIDQAFASVDLGTWAPHGEATAAATDLTDLRSVRALFAQLAAGHVRQVRDFVLDLRLSDAPVHWISLCEPALRSLRHAAEKLEQPDLCGALDAFAEALSTAGHPGGAGSIHGPWRATLLARYEALVACMPQAFALDLDQSQREGVILQSLLLQVAGVRKITVDKLVAAGLSTLEAMMLARAGDVAATTGISDALAARIVERFQAYRDQVRNGVPDSTREHERHQLTELTARLRREHDEHELAAQGWSRESEARKRRLRGARLHTLMEIQVVLARLGEVDRLGEIERLPFEKRVVLLESFLEEASAKYGAVLTNATREAAPS